MEKLNLDDPMTKSADIIEGNIEVLRATFPDIFSEGKLSVESLKQLVGEAIDDSEEKYGLNWHGKRKAKQVALMPSTGTLRPAKDDSVEWDSTENLMIEGDNLEVLKLLQKSYANKIKVIYIDPPYNTGSDFVYPDDFRDSLKNYLELTGQTEGGIRQSSNTEASGRFHTDWLNMMYPRLKLARSLLSNDGAIFVTIDDNEAARLRCLMDEIFGEENFIANVVWNHTKQSKNDERFFSRHHNQILVFRKSDQLKPFRFDRSEQDNANYSNPDKDPKGDWRAGDVRSPSFRETLRFPIKTPSGKLIQPPENGWRWSEESVQEKIQTGEIVFSSDETRIIRKIYLANQDGRTPENLWMGEFAGTTRQANAELKELFSESPFDTPKPVQLISKIISLCSNSDNDIVLDFFAGSGTTGHAVMNQSVIDGISRKFILVQLPEPLSEDEKDQKTAALLCKKLGKPKNISELTKERLRRAAKKIRDENDGKRVDLGFKVFKLDSSNIRAWEPNKDDIAASLLDSTEHIKSGRTEDDILYELLIKLGLDLAVPIETKTIEGKQVHSIGAGALIACLPTSITREQVEPLAMGIIAWHCEEAPSGEVTVVFRDSAFADDVAKTNMAAILSQHGLTTVRSL